MYKMSGAYKADRMIKGEGSDDSDYMQDGNLHL